jgi:DNA-binding PadR family transcriptional regulator
MGREPRGHTCLLPIYRNIRYIDFMCTNENAGGKGGSGRHRSMDGGNASLGRFFAHGDLRLIILHLISERPRHGYEMIKWIEEAVAGIYSPSPGTIYPTLTMLEEAGQVVVLPASEGPRKFYQITDQGNAFLEANKQALATLLTRMAEAARTHGEAAIPAELERALDGLRIAIRQTLSGGEPDQDRVDAIRSAVDEATARIGKL